MLRPRHLACAVALALASSAAFAQSAPPVQPSAHAGLFDNVVAFGDSLSDNGNLHTIEPGSQQRFTTNPGKVAVELVAQHYGYTLAPSTSGGTDYAWGGARAATDLGPIISMQTQVGDYLAANGDHADANTLYTAWIGANDLFAAGNDPANAQTIALSAVNAEVATLKQLHDAGANYIVVFNLPDVSKTPGIRGTSEAASAGLLAMLYNSVLNAGLSQIGTGIIPVNTYALLNQVIADPARYGFSNVTNQACTTSSSINCSASTLVAPDAASSYLFADSVHPTAAAHAMLAQYAESIIAAPGEMSLLGEAPLQINQSLNRSVLDQAAASLANAPGNGLRVWANYDYARQHLDAQVNSPKSSNDVNTLSVGADIHPSDAVTAGMALTVGQQKDNFAGNQGGFKLQDLLATGYMMWGWEQGYFGAIGSFGHLGYTDIHRNIPIGSTVLYEDGSTSGSHAAFALTGGWWLNFGAWRTGPYADVSWQHIHVNAYRENGNDATAMTFGRQDRRALIGTLGWQLAANLQIGSALLHPFARVAWNHDNDADPRDVSAGLVTMPGTFALPGFAPDSNWGSVGVGLAADFTSNFSGWIGYDGRFSDSSQRVNSLNVGAKFRF